jgi:hypothetical protein
MKVLLLTIGFILVLGGMYTIRNPGAFVMSSSGPSPTSEFPVELRDNVSATRGQLTGYASLLLGVGSIAAGIFWKNFDSSKSIDDL